MDQETGFTGWVLAGVGTIVSTLAGLVAMFYRQQVTDHKTSESELKSKIVTLEQRADECEEDRESLRIKHAVLEERVAKLEAKKNQA